MNKELLLGKLVLAFQKEYNRLPVKLELTGLKELASILWDTGRYKELDEHKILHILRRRELGHG